MKQNNTSKIAPIIYHYTDYRKFLHDYFNFQKESNPVFSHRYFMQKAGYNSLGLYNGIVRGACNLSQKMLPKFAQAMKLSTKEEHYLSLLVHYDMARTNSQREARFEELENAKPKKNHIRLMEFQKKYYKQWYTVAIREALLILDIDTNYESLARFLNPSITTDEAKDSINTLYQLSMIQKNSHGYWKPTATLVVSGAEIGPDIIKKYQTNKIRMAEKAMHTIPKEERHITSHTWALSEKKYKKLIEMIKTFQDEIDLEAEDDKNQDRVYQFNIQLFPLTNKSEDIVNVLYEKELV